jgi:transcriptional regulator with XRE-family HTH domain
MNTSSEIRELRARLGWSQIKLAEYLRVHQSTVSALERKEGPIKGPVTILLAQLAAEAGSAAQ